MLHHIPSCCLWYVDKFPWGSQKLTYYEQLNSNLYEISTFLANFVVVFFYDNVDCTFSISDVFYRWQ